MQTVLIIFIQYMYRVQCHSIEFEFIFRFVFAGFQIVKGTNKQIYEPAFSLKRSLWRKNTRISREAFLICLLTFHVKTNRV